MAGGYPFDRTGLLRQVRGDFPQYGQVPDEQLWTGLTNRFPALTALVEPSSYGAGAAPAAAPEDLARTVQTLLPSYASVPAAELLSRIQARYPAVQVAAAPVAPPPATPVRASARNPFSAFLQGWLEKREANKLTGGLIHQFPPLEEIPAPPEAVERGEEGRRQKAEGRIGSGAGTPPAYPEPGMVPVGRVQPTAARAWPAARAEMQGPLGVLGMGTSPTGRPAEMLPQLRQSVAPMPWEQRRSAEFKRIAEASELDKTWMNAYANGVIGGLTRMGLRQFAPESLATDTANLIRTAGEAGLLDAKTPAAQFWLRELPTLVSDLPLFNLMHGMHPGAVLATLATGKQLIEESEGGEFNSPEVLKAAAFGTMMWGGGKLLDMTPLGKVLAERSGGGLARVGKGVARAGIVAGPASLIDPLTGGDWSIEDFGKTWATFVALDAVRLARAGMGGNLETQLQKYGLDQQSARQLANLAVYGDGRNMAEIARALTTNRKGIRRAAEMWKARFNQGQAAGPAAASGPASGPPPASPSAAAGALAPPIQRPPPASPSAAAGALAPPVQRPPPPPATAQPAPPVQAPPPPPATAQPAPPVQAPPPPPAGTPAAPGEPGQPPPGQPPPGSVPLAPGAARVSRVGVAGIPRWTSAEHAIQHAVDHPELVAQYEEHKRRLDAELMRIVEENDESALPDIGEVGSQASLTQDAVLALRQGITGPPGRLRTVGAERIRAALAGLPTETPADIRTAVTMAGDTVEQIERRFQDIGMGVVVQPMPYAEMHEIDLNNPEQRAALAVHPDVTEEMLNEKGLHFVVTGHVDARYADELGNGQTLQVLFDPGLGLVATPEDLWEEYGHALLNAGLGTAERVGLEAHEALAHDIGRYMRTGERVPAPAPEPTPPAAAVPPADYTQTGDDDANRFIGWLLSQRTETGQTKAGTEAQLGKLRMLSNGSLQRLRTWIQDHGNEYEQRFVDANLAVVTREREAEVAARNVSPATSEPVLPPPAPEPAPEAQQDKFSPMSKKELLRYAKRHKIKLPPRANKQVLRDEIRSREQERESKKLTAQTKADDPLRDAVLELGGIRAYKPRPGSKSKPAWAEEYRKIPLRFRSRTGLPLDEMLENVRDYLGPNATEDTLIEALQGNRRMLSEDAHWEQRQAEYGDWLEHGSELVGAADLAVGDRFTIRGEQYEVMEETDAALRIADGVEHWVPYEAEEDVLRIDKGSLIKADVGASPAAPTAGMGPESEIEGTTFEPPFAVRAVRETPGEFRLEAQTPEQLRAEIERRAKRAAIAKAVARPLTGKALDTTGDLFDRGKADLPLLAPPAPKEEINYAGQLRRPAGPFAIRPVRDEDFAPARILRDAAPRLSAIELPELFALARDALGGRAPEVRRRMQGAYGRARVVEGGPLSEGRIRLRADVADISPERKAQLVKEAAANVTAGTAADADQEYLRLLSAEYEKPEHQEQARAAAVLAHELGHIDDWLDNYTFKRGNILGRIASLNRYVKQTLGALPENQDQILTKQDRVRIRRKAQKAARAELGRDAEQEEINERTVQLYHEAIAEEIEARGLITRQEVHEELKPLSDWWREWMHSAPTEKPAELYADALSVLHNNPDALKARAPIFWRAFWAWLDQKPSVRDAYQRIQTELANGAQLDRTQERVHEMFRAGDEKMTRVLRNLRPDLHRVLDGVSAMLIDRYSPLYRRLGRAGERALGEQNPRYAIEELTGVGTMHELYVRDLDRLVVAPLRAARVTWDQLGELMFYRRVQHERFDKFNPGGMTPKRAGEMIDKLRLDLGPERFAALETAAEGIAANRQAHVIKALTAERMHSPELRARIEDNVYYGTFNVVEHIGEVYGGGVGAAIHPQYGTLKDIQNLATATVLKDLEVITATRRNRARRDIVAALQRTAPGDCSEAPMVWDGRRQAPQEPTDPSQALLVYLDEGTVRGFHVPKGIAEAFTYHHPEWLQMGVIALDVLTQAPFFRQVFVLKRAGFQLFNSMRDFQKMYRGLPGISFLEAVFRWWQALPEAVRTTLGRPTALGREAMEHGLILPREDRARVIEEEAHVERLLKRWHLAPIAERTLAGNLLHRAAMALTLPIRLPLQALEFTGQVVESTSKLAGARDLAERRPDIGPQRRHHIVRTQSGSPAFMRRGFLSPIVGKIWLFSNAQKEGWRSEVELARARPVEWAWKLAVTALVPKLLQWMLYSGIIAGAAFSVRAIRRRREDPEEQAEVTLSSIYHLMSDYDLANYTCIPLGLTATGKAVYLRLPPDENARIAGGLLWKLLQDDREGLLSGLFDYAAGQAPNLSPIIKLGLMWSDFARGRRVFDRFRGRDVLSQQELDAQDHRAWKKMLQTSWNELGGGIVWQFATDDPRSIQTDLERRLGTPVASDILRRFIRVSDRGVAELIQGRKEVVRQQAARESLDRRDLAQHLAIEGISSATEAAMKLGNGELDLSDDEQQTLAQHWEQLDSTLQRFAAERLGGVWMREWASAASVAERVAVLEIMQEVERPRFLPAEPAPGSR